MKTYGDLDLKKLRDECGLDFAHFTYLKGQCSCCYSPKDLPARYWKDGVIPNDKVSYYSNGHTEGDDSVDENEYTYLLFKNAYNGSGTVTKADIICKKQYWGYPTVNIEWGFPYKWLNKVCKELRNQLGDEYRVIKPKDHFTCIQIKYKEKNNK